MDPPWIASFSTDMEGRWALELPNPFHNYSMEGTAVPESVLDAIRRGQWDYEPRSVDSEKYDSTNSLPGSDEKISILAERAEDGLPLWHPNDRRSYDDSEEAFR